MDMILTNPWTGKYITGTFLDGSDTVHKFLENKKILGNDWRFSSERIMYNFNSEGYRCKEEHDIDKRNFILVLGCSNTVGFGLNEQDTFAFKIAHHLEMDLMNLAIGGASNDFIVKQLVRVLSKYKPKRVIINWSGIERLSYWDNNNIDLFSPAEIHKNKWTESYHLHLENNEHKNYFNDYRLTAQTLCELANIPLFEFTLFDGYDDLLTISSGLMKEIPIQDVQQINEYYARDVHIRNGKTIYGHPGVGIHEEIFKRWKDDYLGN